MCGIAGSIGLIEPELIEAVQAASSSQRHRGPDDDGIWQSGAIGGHGAVFGFRRLAIMDLSPAGSQPMVDPVTGNTIAFNGEIYNFAELRGELEQLGAEFRSNSDTEVILKAYGKWGEQAVARLRGMFAIAIYDAQDNSVLLARDRIGIKPLYYSTVKRTNNHSTLIFASEIRALLATNLIDRRLHRNGLNSYLWNGFVAGEQTIAEGIKLLPPGTIARIATDSPHCKPRVYWRMPNEALDIANSSRIEELREELQTAIRQHLISDAPLGVFLSGGIDSSAVAALATQQTSGDPADIRTFNLSFDEGKFDESQYAIAVAKSLGTDHTDVRLTQQDFLGSLDDALTAMDQPTIDGINTYFVSRAVRQAGITVALAGTGGDELFGGYSSFRDAPRASKAARRLRHLPKWLLRATAHLIARLKLGRFGEVAPQTRWGKLGDVFCSGGGLLAAYQISYGLFTQSIHDALLGADNPEMQRGLTLERTAELNDLIGNQSDWHSISTLEIANFLGERLLRDTDWAGMAVSLEVRVPLLDHRVIEAAAACPLSRRFQPLGKKQLLRDLGLERLNPTLFERPKSGFVLPIESWCRQSLKGKVEEALLDRDLCEASGVDPGVTEKLWQSFCSGAPGMYWSRIWAIYALLRWCREHHMRAY
jgi:asparagine synthase (glutamine-hydrolysing)